MRYLHARHRAGCLALRLGFGVRFARSLPRYAPTLPEEFKEEPTNCCGSGCDPCVWEVYHDHLKAYQVALARWEAAGAAAAVAAAAVAGPPSPREPGRFDVGDRARLCNFKTKRLLHMNGLAVDILGEQSSPGSGTMRWNVRPVGGHRVLALPADKLAFQQVGSET
mmetsp:Transcript_152030/g.488135  ORF Transcript_152030/g.488135 Transcript_152030/m.488135 type:complete len:166 (-) Transcript_152030:224-721(-)